MGGGMELGRHLGIHSDHDLFFVSHDSVPLLDLIRDPLLERFTDDSSTDIDDPLLGDLWQVGLVGKVAFNLRLGDSELQDLLNAE